MISFILTTYQENSKLINWCVNRIRKIYPNEPIVMISDGGTDFKDIANTFNCEYIQGERLKHPINSGGKWWKRFFDVANHLNTDYVFKIDADTGLYRKFNFFPPNGDVFGTIVITHEIEIIQGGLQGFPQKTIKTIEKTKICCDKALNDFKIWAKTNNVLKYVLEMQEISTDWTLNYIIDQLKLKKVNWSEVYCTWKDPPSYKHGFAAVHPCKTNYLSESLTFI